MANGNAIARIALVLLSGGTGLALVPQWALADTFHLTSGGRIVGRELSPSSADARALVTIELPTGGRVQVTRACIKEREHSNDRLNEYQRRLATVAATAVAQWELAEWCRANQLVEQRRTHLERVLQFDPDHAAARRALGYSQMNGKWVIRDELQQRDGYVRFEGRWRTRQEIQLMLERKAARAAYIEWNQRLKRWRHQLVEGKPHEAQTAQASFAAIEDPVAIDPLVTLICSEPIRPLKFMYLRVLCRIQHPRAVHQLTYLSLMDRDEDVFEICMREIVARPQPETLKTYVQALKNANNGLVNRAAVAIARLENRDAIGPLIESLVTSHAIATPRPVTPGGLPAGESTFTFALDDEGKSTPMSPRKLPPFVTVQVPNQDVLSALVELSGGISFGFDQPAWRRWYASQRQQLQTVATIRGDGQ